MNETLNHSVAKYIIAKKALAPRRSLNDFEMDKLVVRKPEKADYSGKIFRPVVLFGCYFAFVS